MTYPLLLGDIAHILVGMVAPLDAISGSRCTQDAALIKLYAKNRGDDVLSNAKRILVKNYTFTEVDKAWQNPESTLLGKHFWSALRKAVVVGSVLLIYHVVPPLSFKRTIESLTIQNIAKKTLIDLVASPPFSLIETHTFVLWTPLILKAINIFMEYATVKWAKEYPNVEKSRLRLERLSHLVEGLWGFRTAVLIFTGTINRKIAYKQVFIEFLSKITAVAGENNPIVTNGHELRAFFSRTGALTTVTFAALYALTKQRMHRNIATFVNLVEEVSNVKTSDWNTHISNHSLSPLINKIVEAAEREQITQTDKLYLLQYLKKSLQNLPSSIPDNHPYVALNDCPK